MAAVDDPIVTMAHVRKAGMCSRGARVWFERYGLSYPTFLTQGYPASELEATGDALAIRVAAIARNEQGPTT